MMDENLNREEDLREGVGRIQRWKVREFWTIVGSTISSWMLGSSFSLLYVVYKDYENILAEKGTIILPEYWDYWKAVFMGTLLELPLMPLLTRVMGRNGTQLTGCVFYLLAQLVLVILQSHKRKGLLITSGYFQGISAALIFATSSIYAVEISGFRRRGFYSGSLPSIFFFLGGALNLLLYENLRSWYEIPFINILLALCNFVFAIITPDSPMSLMIRHMPGSAQDVLANLRETPDFFRDLLELRDLYEESRTRVVWSRPSFYKSVAAIIALGLNISFGSGVVYVFLYYYPLWTGSSSSWLTAVLSVAFLGASVGGYLADRVGRKPLIIYATLFNALAHVIFALSELYFENCSSSQDTRYITARAISSGYIFNFFFSTLPATLSLTSEYTFPKIRYLASTAWSVTVWTGLALSLGYYALPASKNDAPFFNFGFYALSGLVEAGVFYCLLTETRGRSILGIREALDGGEE